MTCSNPRSTLDYEIRPWCNVNSGCKFLVWLSKFLFWAESYISCQNCFLQSLQSPCWPCLGFETKKNIFFHRNQTNYAFLHLGMKGYLKTWNMWEIGPKNWKKVANLFQKACSTGFFGLRLPHIHIGARKIPQIRSYGSPWPSNTYEYPTSKLSIYAYGNGNDG